MGYFKPGTVWQEGNVNNSMILKMNADKKPWPGIYIKSRFGIVLIQKMKEEIIAMYLNKYDFIYQSIGIATAAKTYFGKNQKEFRRSACLSILRPRDP